METEKNSIYGDRCFKFKSYYVVWKLVALWEGEEPIGQFKSYYVVWKPEEEGGRQLRNLSLNRTMQYGNNKRKNK